MSKHKASLTSRLGPNGRATEAWLDQMREFDADTYRRLGEGRDPLLQLLFSPRVIDAVSHARRQRHQVAWNAYNAAQQIGATRDPDPDMYGTRVAAEFAAVLTFHDLLDPAHRFAVQQALTLLLEGQSSSEPETVAAMAPQPAWAE